MRCYIIAFGRGMDTDWGQALQQMSGWQGNQNYRYRKIDETLIVLVSNNIDLSPAQLVQEIKRNLSIGDRIEVYILRPGPKHPPCNENYSRGQGVINTGKTSGQFVTDIVNPVLANNIQNLNNYIQGNVPPLIIDPLIIIFTEELRDVSGKIDRREEWINAIKNTKGTFYDDNLNQINTTTVDQIRQNLQDSPRVIEFIVNSNTVLFVKENGLGKEKNSKGGIDDLLEKILSKWGKGLKKEDIYVAVHDLNDYLKDESKFKDKVAYICDFHHYDYGPDKEFCNLLIELLKNIEMGENICEKIIEKIKELAMCERKKISIIKHKIGDIFLPVDIDLQGLVETSFDKNYLNEVLTAWKNRNPENKLGEARELVYKSYESSSEQEKCLEEIKEEAKRTKKDEKEKEEIENIWKKVKAILPKEEEELVEEKLKDLRELYDKAKKILECLNNGNAKQLKEICKDGRNPFHEWFSKLCDILDELGEKIRRNE